jgi:hypothetical protein
MTDETMTFEAVYGVMKFIPPTYDQYKIKRVLLFGKKRLFKVRSGLLDFKYDPKIQLSVCDNGTLIGTEEAIEMYRDGNHD